MNKNFDLNQQYALYLERMSLVEEKMHPQQKIQLKQAFFGACGQLLILLRDEAGSLPEDQATEVFQGMLDQVGNYWLSQKGEQN